MDLQKETIIRGILIFVGIILTLSGLIFLIREIFFLTSSVEVDNLSTLLHLDYSMFLIFGMMVFLGFIFLQIAFYWKNFFKKLAQLFISFSVFFLIFGFFFLSLNFYSSDFTDSIQPSINYLVINSLIEDLNTKSIEYKNISLNLIFSSDTTEEIFYVNNLTLFQTNLIAKELKIMNLTENKRIYFIKSLISNYYDAIRLNQSNLLNSTFSFSIFNRDLMEVNGFNFDNLEKISFEDLRNQVLLNNDAKLKFLLASNRQEKKVFFSNLSEEEVNLIWTNLKLKGSFNFNSKEKVSQFFFFSFITDFLNNNQIDFPTIDVATIPSTQPISYSKLGEYDIFNKNISYASKELDLFRNYCLNLNNSNDIICSQFLTTNYPNFVLLLTNFTMGNNTILKEKVIKEYGTLNKFQTSIEAKTLKYSNYFILFFILLLFGFLSCYFHYTYMLETSTPKITFFYKFSKLMFFSYFFNFVLVLITYFLLKSKILIGFIANNANLNLVNIILSLEHMPFYLIILKVFSLFIYLSLSYFILISFFLILFYFLNKN